MRDMEIPKDHKIIKIPRKIDEKILLNIINIKKNIMKTKYYRRVIGWN